jgi:hypothetical protein
MEKIRLSMKRLFCREYIDYYEPFWDKIFSGYEVIVGRHVDVIERKLKGILVCYNAMRQ